MEMVAKMVSLSFCRQNIREKHAMLLDLPIPEWDPRYKDHMIVMGIEPRAEAHLSVESRDAKLGPVSEHVEYVPVSAAEVAAVEYPFSRMAIGPALNDAGFREIASTVLAAAIEEDGRDIDALQLTVVIARTEYMVHPGGASGLPEVLWLPLFNPPASRDDWQLERATAAWLQGFIAGHFAKLEA